MKITKIEPYGSKNTFSKIFADGEYLISLPEELITRFALKVGVEVNEDSFKELRRAALVRRARERLLYSLDRRLHSEKELREKLRGNYPPDVIDAAIAELDRLGLIDDKAFALAFSEQRLKVKRKGKFAIVSELVLKGVDKQTAQNAVESVLEQNSGEFEFALSAAQKYKNELDTPKGKQRLYAALMRRGFSYNTVKKVMQRLCDELLEFDD